MNQKAARAVMNWLTVCIMIFGTCTSILAQPDLSEKKVLIIHAFEGNAPIFLKTDQGISKALQSGGISGLNQFFESLELRRNPGPEHRKILVEQMRRRYSDRDLDMVITMYPEALEFVLKDCRDVLPHVPVLALYLPQDFEVQEQGRRIIGHFSRVDIAGTLGIALKLVPTAKRVYLVSGAHEVDRRLEEQARRDVKKWEGKLEFLSLSHLPSEGILRTVASTPPGSIVILMGFAREVTGRNTTSQQVAQRLGRVSRAPVFGIIDTMLGHGIAGGSIVGFEHIGTKAGQLAVDMIGSVKTPATALPAVLDVPPVPMFDWKQLRHWKLDEEDLPEGSIVVNREFTLWSVRYYIIGLLAFCLAEAALIVFLFALRRRKSIVEQSFQESEERLDLAITAAEAGIWVMNTDTDTIWMTDKMRELFQFAPDEVVNVARFMEAIHPDDREHVGALVRQSLEKRELLMVEYRTLHSDGRIRWIVSRGRPHSGRSGMPGRLMGISVDITARKTTELQLVESQALLAALVESTSDMIWSVDAERFGLLTFNNGLYEYFLHQRGMRIEAGMRPEDLFPTDDFAQLWRTFYRRALEEGSFTTEYRVFAGTQTLHLNLNRLKRGDVVFGVSVFGQDITERKRAEDALRESEAKYRSLYESMMDGYVKVGMDGKILEFNESYREMTGYEPEELLRLTYRDITPEKWFTFESDLIEQIGERGYTEVYEKEYRKKDGTVFPVELRTFLLKGEAGRDIGTWAIVRDITARKLFESETRKLQEELAHVTRVSTMGELTSSLAHEINQPLAAILSNAQAAQRYLSQDNPDMKEIAEILGDIIRDDNRAADVIRKIRSLLKKEESRYETLIMNDIIEEILNVIRSDSVLTAVSIKNEFDTSLPAVWGDRIQLQQVILNLLLNGAEAMRDAGLERRALTVRTARRDGRFAEVSISDIGPGFPEDAASRLFDSFYTTKTGGMGMGLAISKEIVKSHRGEIWAVNNPDGGATFSFTVPFDNAVRL